MDAATGALGDDGAMTGIHLKQCVPIVGNQGTCKIARAAGNDRGKLIDKREFLPSGAAGCTEYTALTDVATARDFWRTSTANNYNRLVAAYAGDTHGRLWRYAANGEWEVAMDLGCQHPLHFAPTVVQLDRDNPMANRGDIYLVQVTNSSLDGDTIGFEESRLVIQKEKADADQDVSVASGFGSGGRVSLKVSEICANTSGASCLEHLPANARPAGTPIALLMDGSAGFKLISLWYSPPEGGCGKARTYLAVIDVAGNQVSQKVGVQLANEAVLGSVVAGNTLYVATASGLIDVGKLASITVKTSGSAGSSSDGGRFRAVAWTEIGE